MSRVRRIMNWHSMIWNRAVLKAPFDGIVANLFGKQYNLPNTSRTFLPYFVSEGDGSGSLRYSKVNFL